MKRLWECERFVGCPRCKAQPGESCREPSGAKAPSPHRARRDVFEDDPNEDDTMRLLRRIVKEEE